MKDLIEMNKQERKSKWRGEVAARLRRDFADVQWEDHKKRIIRVTTNGITKYFALELRETYNQQDIDNVRDMVLVIMYADVIKNSTDNPIFIDKDV